MKSNTDCFISGHYYIIDSPIDSITGSYYVKCQRCNNRIAVNDKCYQQRKDGTYKL